MSLDLKEKSQRRMRLLVSVLVGVVVLLVALVVTLMTAGGGDDGGNGGDSAKPEPTPSASKVPEEDGYTDPDHWVALPKGSKKVNGLEAGFPHNAKGAAAMAAASTRSAWTLDEKQVKRGAETYTVKQYRAPMAQQSSAGVDGVKQLIGVPAGTEPPKDANVTGVPIGVQWQQKSANRVVVFVLTRITSSAGDGAETKTKLQATPAEIVWEDGDWKATPTPKGGTPQAPEPADLGSAAFNSAGWKAIQEGDRR